MTITIGNEIKLAVDMVGLRTLFEKSNQRERVEIVILAKDNCSLNLRVSKISLMSGEYTLKGTIWRHWGTVTEIALVFKMDSVGNPLPGRITEVNCP